MTVLDPTLLSSIGDLELVARVMIDGTVSGLHRSPFHGYSAEFSQYRHYRAGDDLKYIDWKLFARTDRLYTKQYRETTNMVAEIAIDASASMGFRGRTGVTKIAYARLLAAALAYLISRQGDAVGLVVYDDGVRQYVPSRAGPSHLRRLLVDLTKLKASGGTSLAGAAVQPALAAPGQPVTIRAAVRATSNAVPAVEASLVAPDGSQQFVRLWPLAEPGVFEGTVTAHHAGRYEARASLIGDLTAAAPLLIDDGVRQPPGDDRDAMELVAKATGGVVTDGSTLEPLERHLRGLARRDGPADRHPTRSVWWGLAFAAALCGEWALRRRGGAR